MAAPRDSDLPVFTYHRHTITYAGVAPAAAGTAIGFDRQIAGNAGQPAFGILEFDAVTGQDVTIAIAGICQCISSGGGIFIGNAIVFDSFGRATTVAAGVQIFGRALSAATAAGQKIQVLITREGTN